MFEVGQLQLRLLLCLQSERTSKYFPKIHNLELCSKFAKRLLKVSEPFLSSTEKKIRNVFVLYCLGR